MITLMLLCGGARYWAVHELTASLHAQRAAADLQRNHMYAEMMHESIRADVLAVIASNNPATNLSLKENKAALDEHIQSLKTAIRTDVAYGQSEEVASAARRLVAPVADYAAAGERIGDAPNPAAMPSQLPAFLDRFHSVEASMADCSSAIEEHASEVARHAERLSLIASILVVLTLIASVGALVAAAVAVRRHLVQPLCGLVESMRGLASGNLDTDVPSVEREDELGAMARAMSEFRNQLKIATHAKDVQTDLIVDSFGNSLDALASGELSAEITEELDGPFALLKTNFNDALRSLRQLVGSILENTSRIQSGSTEIAQASEDLARRTESSAASLEQTSAALGQIDSRLKGGAIASMRTVERADQALATVEGGRSTAEHAVAAMCRVSDSAKGIDTVIEGLDKIAFQTRVLAMNAAIEAGRAGEAGRGFAVVADLVSALAMRAEEEAKRARDQLTVTQSEIGLAVGEVHKMDGALQRISEDVTEVHGLLATMAADNQAQSLTISEIASAIALMDESTQQNAAMVEQTSAASRNLSFEVRTLAQSASHFLTGKAGGAPGVRKALPEGVAKHFVPQKPRSNGAHESAVPAASFDVGSADEWKDF